MKSDIPDELFVFPDSSSSIGEPNRKFSKSNITQEDIDDMSVDTSFPLRNPNYLPVVVDVIPF